VICLNEAVMRKLRRTDSKSYPFGEQTFVAVAAALGKRNVTIDDGT
jgi:hypothetical protein